MRTVAAVCPPARKIPGSYDPYATRCGGERPKQLGMCPSCHHNLVEIDLRLGDVKVTMHSCSTCEQKWWDLNGRQLELGTVLALASPHR